MRQGESRVEKKKGVERSGVERRVEESMVGERKGRKMRARGKKRVDLRRGEKGKG